MGDTVVLFGKYSRSPGQNAIRSSVMLSMRLQSTTRRTRGACAFTAAYGLFASSCGTGAAAVAASSDDSGSVAAPDASSGGVGTGGVCVDVSHVDKMQKDGLDVIGSGFDAYEGHMIRIVATQGEPTYGLGEAPIKGGSFEILMPHVLGDYTGLGVYVDMVRDDACNPGSEILWQEATGPRRVALASR